MSHRQSRRALRVESQRDARQCIDQMGTSIVVPRCPQRIVSLVPSQTELLFDLGLEDRIIGVTRYCVHPAKGVARVANVGGTKRFNFPVIAALAPDLIIGNKEENYQEGIAKLRAVYPVWMSDVNTVDDAIDMIERIGTLTDTEAVARPMADRIRVSWQSPAATSALRVAYLIWKKPYMAVGDRTFIDDVLTRLGAKNVFAGLPRYPETDLDTLRVLNPDVVMLSSEPYPFTDQHVRELGLELPATTVIGVDGEMFSWYGSRLMRSPAYFRRLFREISRRASRGQD